MSFPLKIMEQFDKKVIWNAVSAYLLVWVCLFFLFNKKIEFKHPFVRSHIRSASILHAALLLMLYTMSFPFLGNQVFLSYSINQIVTIIFSLSIFWLILYSMLQAQRGKTISLSRILQVSSKENISFSSSEKHKEEEKLSLILAHIPLVWYHNIPLHLQQEHYRDIIIINSIITSLCIILLITGYSSLGSFLFLIYIIISVFQSFRLIIEGHITTPNLEKVPGIFEISIYTRSLLKYLFSYLSQKQKFKSFSEVYNKTLTLTLESEKEELKHLQDMKPLSFDSRILYIPWINLIWLFYFRTQEKIHIINSLSITAISCILFFILAYEPYVFLCMLFPIFYGIGYLPRKAYKLPLIYDFYVMTSYVIAKIFSVITLGHQLHKTDKKVTITLNTEKKWKASPSVKDKTLQVEQPSQDEEFEVKDIQK